MKKLLLAIIAVLIIIGLYFGLRPPQPTSTEPIKIGVLYPLTLEAAAWGDPAKRGAELAIKEINDAGGVAGRQLQAIYEDSQCNPTIGVNAANKLINLDQIKFIVGDICSPVVMPMAPIAEKNKVIVIAQGSSPNITQAGDYIFRNWPSDEYQGEVMARFTLNDLSFRRLAVLVETQEYTLGLANAFIENFEKLGGKIVIKEAFNTRDRDFRTQLLKIKSANVDAIYISTTIAYGKIARQMKELNTTLPILGGDAVGTKEVLEDAGGSLEGAYYSFPFFDEKSEVIQNFQRKHAALFGAESPLVNVSAHGYDAVKLLAKALNQCDPKFTTDCMKNELYQIKNFPGVSGETTFDQNGDVIKPYGVYRIVNNQPALIKKF